MTKFSMNKDLYLSIYRKAMFIRQFEEKLIDLELSKKIEIPVYLSIGQEFIAASLATYFGNSVSIFAQHRSHAYFLAFGGKPESLMWEIMGDKEKGCSNGYGGSVGIKSIDAKLYGHTGIMGEQAYLGVGFAFAQNSPVLIILGDATIEEDYFIPSIGFAVTHNLRTVFICEDNGLAVLTPTNKRRSWRSLDLVSSLGVPSVEIVDDPKLIYRALRELPSTGPIFLNIQTQRKVRHTGAKMEGNVLWDREKDFASEISSIFGTGELDKIYDETSACIQKIFR